MTFKTQHEAQGELSHIRRAAEHVLLKTNLRPKTAVILGTGLSGIGQFMEADVSLPYGEIPSFPVSTVRGTRGFYIWGASAAWRRR